jgi:hypothetical protein
MFYRLHSLIDAHGGEGDGEKRGSRGLLMYPSKDFEKIGHKNAIKHENRFSHNPEYPLQ